MQINYFSYVYILQFFRYLILIRNSIIKVKIIQSHVQLDNNLLKRTI